MVDNTITAEESNAFEQKAEVVRHAHTAMQQAIDSLTSLEGAEHFNGWISENQDTIRSAIRSGDADTLRDILASYTPPAGTAENVLSAISTYRASATSLLSASRDVDDFITEHGGSNSLRTLIADLALSDLQADVDISTLNERDRAILTAIRTMDETGVEQVTIGGAVEVNQSTVAAAEAGEDVRETIREQRLQRLAEINQRWGLDVANQAAGDRFNEESGKSERLEGDTIGIADVQQQLIAALGSEAANLGTYGPNGDGADGVWGPRTEAAMMAYARANNIDVSTDAAKAAFLDNVLEGRITIQPREVAPAPAAAPVHSASIPLGDTIDIVPRFDVDALRADALEARADALQALTDYARADAMQKQLGIAPTGDDYERFMQLRAEAGQAFQTLGINPVAGLARLEQATSTLVDGIEGAATQAVIDDIGTRAADFASRPVQGPGEAELAIMGDHDGDGIALLGGSEDGRGITSSLDTGASMDDVRFALYDGVNGLEVDVANASNQLQAANFELSTEGQATLIAALNEFKQDMQAAGITSIALDTSFTRAMEDNVLTTTEFSNILNVAQQAAQDRDQGAAR